MSCKWKSFGLSAFLALFAAGAAVASVKHPPLPEPIREAIPELRPLGQGTLTWFGLALGADLAIPPSILADVIDWGRGGAGPAQEGGYFGLWSLVTKLNLALAAPLSAAPAGAAAPNGG